ncbi:MAG: Hsp20/alpha crystallin family protein [Candidatus Eremiobacteraeota bacterium]|nr:Hsp20/alpha crystallin family protein [Candidatus Eremiobacteraeota bacterium]
MRQLWHRYNPNTDVFYDDDSGRMVVHVELAGADPDSLSVAVDDDGLSITGTRVDRAGPCGSIIQKEIEYGPFAKKLRLPAPIDVDAATATYTDGILTIVLPLSRTEMQTPRALRMIVRKISI